MRLKVRAGLRGINPIDLATLMLVLSILMLAVTYLINGLDYTGSPPPLQGIAVTDVKAKLEDKDTVRVYIEGRTADIRRVVIDDVVLRWSNRSVNAIDISVELGWTRQFLGIGSMYTLIINAVFDIDSQSQLKPGDRVFIDIYYCIYSVCKVKTVKAVVEEP